MDYVKVYKNFIDKNLCREVVNYANNFEWEKHKYFKAVTNESIQFENDLSVSAGNIPLAKQINQKVWDAINQYVLKDFSSFEPWFDGWSGHSYVRFNRYDEKTEMRLHCDHIHSLFDGTRKGIPVLTILGVLNDNYKGGEFMMFGDKKIELPEGSVIVFPSNFMFPHEVKPITSGVRYSFVSWSW